MPAPPDEFITLLRDLCRPLGALRARRMFGGWGLYFDGPMIGLVADRRLFLKVDAETEPSFIAAACEPFVYHGGGRTIRMSYWSVPDDALEHPDELRPWLQRAIAAAERAAQAKRSADMKTAARKPRRR